MIYFIIDQFHPKDIGEVQDRLSLIVFAGGCGDVNLDLVLGPDGFNFTYNHDPVQLIT